MLAALQGEKLAPFSPVLRGEGLGMRGEWVAGWLYFLSSSAWERTSSTILSDLPLRTANASVTNVIVPTFFP
jgi:hypothetical protein